jgi:hypothetical protein
MQRGDEVVVALLRLVVQRCAFLHGRGEGGRVDRAGKVLDLLDHVQ